MRLALFFLLVLTITVSVTQALDINDYIDCKNKCSREDKQELFVCTNEKNFRNRCEYNCQEGKPEESIECKKGSFEDCWNNVCTGEERANEDKVCAKGFNESAIGTCALKCHLKTNKGKDAKIEPC